MRDRLMSMPVWSLFLVIALPCTAVFSVIDLISGDSVPRAFIPAAFFGVLAGVAVTLGLKLAARMEKRVFGDASVDVRREARRAARTGPVPSDPDVRTAALELAQGDLKRLLRSRPWMTAILVLLVVSEIGLAFTSSPWSLLVLVPLVPVLSFQLIVFPKRLRARIALLSAAQ